MIGAPPNNQAGKPRGYAPNRPLGQTPGKAPADPKAKLPNPFAGKLAGKLPGPLSGQLSWKLPRQLHWLEAKLAPTLSWLFYDESPPESAEASIRRHIIAGSVLIGVLAFGLGGWASTAEISGALIAQGSLVVDSNVKKVQHPTGGVVGELLAHDGDHVKEGQVLLRLDETVTRANLAIVTKGLNELYARKARLAAERDGADSVPTPRELAQNADDPDVKEALNSERKLFDLRRAARAGQKGQLQERITQLQQEITGIDAQLTAKDQELALIAQELQGVRELWQKNLIQLSRLTSLQRDEAKIQGERGQLVAQSAEAKGKIAETQLQIIQIDQDLSSDVAKELRETESKIGEYVERKVTAEDQLKRTDIRAPQDGTVFQSTANTVGGVVTAGDPIMLIVPESDNLLVEVKVDPKDIDQVQIDQPVVLRFSSFNARTTPEINGKVVRIAADTSTDQRTGASYYLVRISMSADEVRRLGDVKLTPGMPVEAFIQTGERTMLSYLIKPLHDQFMRAFREK
ncbi:MAG: HlyD family type I secretion periplasmic adaptor subunit [Xanthobacteraceae bacterium]